MAAVGLMESAQGSGVVQYECIKSIQGSTEAQCTHKCWSDCCCPVKVS